LTPNGTIKLVDFGLVKLLHPDDNRTVTVLQGRATIQYAPLEQIGGDSGYTDGRSDIYSLGATLYHLLTNEPPPDAKTRYIRPKTQTPLSIREINPEVSIQTEQAILHALGLHPEDRPDNIQQFRRELLSGAPIVINGRITNGWRFAFWRNRVLLALIAALLTLAIILTFTPGLSGLNSTSGNPPISEVSR
jgi:serine/threonine-protein kinase